MTPETTNARPFLWGPVKSALIQDARDHGPGTILKLCDEEHQRVKEMMVAVLSDLGRDDTKMVEEVLHHFFPQKKAAGTLQRAWQLVHSKAPVELDKRSSSARTIAVEVASNLSLTWALEAAALHEDPATRAAAVRFIYHLWQREPKAGFTILQDLSGLVMHGPVPDPGALETVFGLSLAIFFDYQKDEQVLLRLQAIWRRIINSVFGINEQATRLGRLARDLVRDQVISIAIRHAFNLLKDLPKYNLVTYDDVLSFFKMKPEDKALYKRLNRYIDPEGRYSQEEMKRDLLATLQMRSILAEGVVWIVFAVQMVHSEGRLFPFLKEFFEQARRDPVPNTWMFYSTLGIVSILDRDPKTPLADEVFQFLVYAAGTCQDYFAKHPTVPGLTRTMYGPNAVFLNDVVYWQYKREGTTHVAWLEVWLKERIAKALANNDEQFFEYVMGTELPLIGIEGHLPRCALEVLSLFLTDLGTGPLTKKIDEMIIGTLARLRRAYPDEVDDFLEEHNIAGEMQLEIRTREPLETVGELIGGTRAIGFVVDAAINTPPLREKIIDVFAKAADAENANKWFEYVLREIINTVYGGEALRQISL